MNRFFVSKKSFHGQTVLLGSDHAHQLRDVLRMKEGEHIVVLDNEGLEYDVVLTQVRREQVVGQIKEKSPASGEPAVQVTLFQSLLTRDKFEVVLQKCTEVGVTEFVPMVTERSLIRETFIKPEKVDRWQRIITEAAEQSHRGRIPKLSPPVTFEQALGGLADFDCRLITWPAPESAIRLADYRGPAEGGLSLRQALRADNKNVPRTVALLIGPEGGFSEREVELAKESGAIPITLGPRILRTETAAIVASALVLYEVSL
jgi:16S rRNA (uracil1498-N3)-methyltransferase